MKDFKMNANTIIEHINHINREIKNLPTDQHRIEKLKRYKAYAGFYKFLYCCESMEHSGTSSPKIVRASGVKKCLFELSYEKRTDTTNHCLITKTLTDKVRYFLVYSTSSNGAAHVFYIALDEHKNTIEDNAK